MDNSASKISTSIVTFIFLGLIPLVAIVLFIISLKEEWSDKMFWADEITV